MISLGKEALLNARPRPVSPHYSEMSQRDGPPVQQRPHRRHLARRSCRDASGRTSADHRAGRISSARRYPHAAPGKARTYAGRLRCRALSPIIYAVLCPRERWSRLGHDRRDEPAQPKDSRRSFSRSPSTKVRARRTSAKTPPGWCRTATSPASRARRPCSTGRTWSRAGGSCSSGSARGISFTREKLRRAAATVARRARTLKLREAAFSLPICRTRDAGGGAGRGGGRELGLYRFDRHKSGAERHELENFWLVAGRRGADEDQRRAPRSARRSRRGPLLARDLANEPSNVATPEYLAQRAREIAERHGMEVDGPRPGRYRGGRSHGTRDRRPVRRPTSRALSCWSTAREAKPRPSSSSARPSPSTPAASP